MKYIKIFNFTGDFAENKDTAREIRVKMIIPYLEKKQKIILDFEDVESATQSFVHALISDVIRKKGAGVLSNIYFQNCNKVIKKIIEIVVEYMQEPI